MLKLGKYINLALRRWRDFFVGSVHDLGKVSDSDKVLFKRAAGRERWEIMRSIRKKDIALPSFHPNIPLLPIILTHHEHWTARFTLGAKGRKSRSSVPIFTVFDAYYCRPTEAVSPGQTKEEAISEFEDVPEASLSGDCDLFINLLAQEKRFCSRHVKHK
jgi:hypothetical protein